MQDTERTSDTSRLPYSPLTLPELNERTRSAEAEVAWLAAALYRDGNLPSSDGSVARLREHIAVLDEAQDAVMARLS